MKVSGQALDVYISPTIDINQLLDLSCECTASNDQFCRLLAHCFTLMSFRKLLCAVHCLLCFLKYQYSSVSNLRLSGLTLVSTPLGALRSTA